MGLGVLAMGCPQPQPTGPVDTTDTGDAGELGQLVANPCELDFGTIAPGEIARSQSIELSNTGTALITVDAIDVAEPFQVTAATPLDVQTTFRFSVAFEPSSDAFGSFEETLTVTPGTADVPVVECVVRAEVSADSDGDGFDAAEAGGLDCDDSDPTVNPDADEVWYDGVDQDCDGVNDYDKDGDGFASLVHFPFANECVEREVPGDDTSACAIYGGDCQDVDPTINPRAEDTWYDGADSDCDGSDDFDQDGDGYASAEYGGNDCNDLFLGANPGATEVFNGVDDDCNGLVDDGADPANADVKVPGDTEASQVGTSVDFIDVQDDGTWDALVAVPGLDAAAGGTTQLRGGVAIWLDADLSNNDIADTDADIYVEGKNSNDGLGYRAVNLGDFDGDDIDDLAVSSIRFSGRAGYVWVFSGADIDSSGTYNTDDAMASFRGVSDWNLGASLYNRTDLDGDGYADLVAVASPYRTPYIGIGIQYGSDEQSGLTDFTKMDAYFGWRCGSFSSSTSTYYWESCDTNPVYSWTGEPGSDIGGPESARFAGHAAGDLNGDGYDDIGFGNPTEDQGGKNTGEAWVLFGRGFEYANANAHIRDAAAVIARGSAAEDKVGAYVGVVPDMDLDGNDELVVVDGARKTMYLIYGSSSLGESQLALASDSDAWFTSLGGEPSAVAGAGDWTSDGVDDIVIGLGRSGGTSKGRAYLLEGKAWSGSHRMADVASATLEGSDYNGAFGYSISPVPYDTDGDGAMDVMFGDPSYDDQDSTKEGPEGSVFLFRGF